MSELVNFFEKLKEDLNDVNWLVVGLTDYKEVILNEELYAELTDGSQYEKQDDYYLYQTQHGEDYFSGTIIYPITESKALIIHYDC